MEENLLFANTCGKIYADRVIFAFEHKEKVIPIEEIKRVETISGIKTNSLLIMFVPFSFIIFTYVVNELEVILKIIIWIIALFFTAISVFSLKRTFHIRLVMRDKPSLNIRVAGNNIKDAKKFSVFLHKQLQLEQIKNPETISSGILTVTK